MSKKIGFFLCLICPLFFILVGYPLEDKMQNSGNRFTISERCFVVGNTNQFFSCLKSNKRLGGRSFIGQVVLELNALQYGMGYIFLICFLCHLGVLAGMTIFSGDK